MKKLFLLLAIGSVAMNVGAQQLQVTNGNNDIKVRPYINIPAPGTPSGTAATTGAHKSTSTLDRWYNYTTYMRLKSAYDATTSTPSDNVDGYGPETWSDTFGILGYLSSTGSYQHKYINLVSLGAVLNPQYAGFNRGDLYGPSSFMQIKNSDAPTWDSVSIEYFYQYGSKSTAAHTDTLRLSLVYGNGTTTSNVFLGGPITSTHYGSISFEDVPFDSVTVVAAGPTTSYMDVLLTNADTSSFNQVKSFHIAANVVAHTLVETGATTIAVPANSYVACTQTFITGEPAPILKSLPGDSLYGPSHIYYNIYAPVVDYYTTGTPATGTLGTTTPDWAPFDATSLNDGLFKTLPNYSNGWGDQYVPNWAWMGVPSGAYYYQYPDIGFHFTCTTCGPVNEGVTGSTLVSSITATPNPAANTLNVVFSLTTASDVKVSLTNVVGQVVATQNISNTTSGKATFNTTALPSGVYVYTLEANGERSTGRVVVAH